MSMMEYYNGLESNEFSEGIEKKKSDMIKNMLLLKIDDELLLKLGVLPLLKIHYLNHDTFSSVIYNST